MIVDFDFIISTEREEKGEKEDMRGGKGLLILIHD